MAKETYVPKGFSQADVEGLKPLIINALEEGGERTLASIANAIRGGTGATRTALEQMMDPIEPKVFRHPGEGHKDARYSLRARQRSKYGKW